MLYSDLGFTSPVVKNGAHRLGSAFLCFLWICTFRPQSLPASWWWVSHDFNWFQRFQRMFHFQWCFMTLFSVVFFPITSIRMYEVVNHLVNPKNQSTSQNLGGLQPSTTSVSRGPDWKDPWRSRRNCARSRPHGPQSGDLREDPVERCHETGEIHGNPRRKWRF